MIVLDNYRAHHAAASVYRWLKDYLPKKWRTLHFAFLPAYAPELNPIEPVWGEVKLVDLAGQLPGSLEEIKKAVSKGLLRVRDNWKKLRKYIEHAGWLD